MTDDRAALHRGYRVAYHGDAADFRVYALAITGAGLLGLGLLGHGMWAFLLAAVTICIATYFLPLAFKDAPRIAVDAKGIAVDDLGVVPWSEIADVQFSNVAVRTMSNRDLVLTLRSSLSQALQPDWRAPFPLSYLMYRCWRLSGDTVVRVNLEVLAQPPEDVFAAVQAARG